MRGIVWGSTLERAINQLNMIIENYKNAAITIETYRNEKNKMFVVFSNGDTWEALAAHKEKLCGRCCNVSYIDYQIDLDTQHEIIYGITKASPYNAYRYFG